MDKDEKITEFSRMIQRVFKNSKITTSNPNVKQ